LIKNSYRWVKQHQNYKWEWELTTSLHFFIVSRFPRLKTEFRALAEKFRDINVSDKFETLGQTFTIVRVFELPPAHQRTDLKYMQIECVCVCVYIYIYKYLC